MKKSLLLFFTLITTLSFAQIPSYVPQNGLRGFYPFSGNANDLSSYGSHLTNNGAVLTTDRNGAANSAYSFDGSTQHLTRTTQNFVLSSTGGFTVSFWMKKASASGGVALIHGSTAANNFIWLFQGGNTGYSYGTNKQNSSWIYAQTAGIAFGIWEHFVLVYDAGAMTLYKNGAIEATSTFTYTSVTSANLPLYIGRGISGGYWNGDLDDLAIWDRALTTCEISDLYNETNTIVGVTAGADSTLCAGQSIVLNGSGATTYLWNQGVTNGTSFAPTTTNTYTLTGMDAAGCSAWDDIVVTVNPISIDAGLSQTVCEGDTITLSGSGGVSYVWNNGVTNATPFVPTVAGNYTVVGTAANGCTRADSVGVFLNPAPVINAGIDTMICDGSSVTLSATGGNFITWNNGVFNNIAFNPTSTATYTVTGTNGFNCQGRDSVVVTVNQPTTSTLNISALDQYILNGTTYSTSGTYTQTILNSAGCDSTITLVLQLDFTGLNELANDKIVWYPNPTIDQLKIIVKQSIENSQVRVFNIKGELVKIALLQNGVNEIDVQNLPSGEYICVFEANADLNFRWMKK